MNTPHFRSVFVLTILLAAVIMTLLSTGWKNYQHYRDKTVYKSGEEAFQRGAAHLDRHEYQQAIDDFTIASSYQPRHTGIYIGRAMAYGKLAQYSKAIKDYDTSLTLVGNNPKHISEKLCLIHLSRAEMYMRLGKYVEARADFRKAWELGQDYAVPCILYARALATFPDSSPTDGRKALALARKACELNETENAIYYDTLAAASARDNRFTWAVEEEKRAIKLAKDPVEKAEFQQRLQLYKHNKVLVEVKGWRYEIR